MRKPMIAGNWKMNMTVDEAVSLVKELKKLVKDIKDTEIIVCPPFTALQSISKETKSSNIKLGAQNMYCEQEGAFTGEISPLMLKNVNADLVILGHSERRHIFNESNELINRKVKCALTNKLKPILCVGETLEEREADKTKDIIKEHVENSLKDITKDDMKNIVIAYEPVWAIGTGKTATPKQAEEVHIFIRNILKDIFDKNTSENTRILYGGSVKPKNIKELMDKQDIDGALVGGASLDAKTFSEIIRWQKK